MRRSILVPVMALLVLSPTSVQAGPDDLLACNTPDAATTVIKPNDTKSFSPAAPQYDPRGETYINLKFQLDLYPAKKGDEASVAAALDWDLRVNDWDLYLRRENGAVIKESRNTQAPPVMAPPGESLSGTVEHCDLFYVTIENFQAVAADGIDPLDLTVSVGNGPSLTL